MLDIADKAKIGRNAVNGDAAAPSSEQMGVLTGDPDGIRAMRVDEAHQLTADLAEQHHPGDIEPLGRRHPEATLEISFDAKAFEHRADLRAASVHHHGVDATVSQEHHVGGERRLQRVVRHGVAAVFDDDDLVVQLLEPRQRGGEHLGLGLGRGRHELYAEFSSTYPWDRSVVRMLARSAPTPRSTVTSISAPDRSTSRAPGAPTLSMHTGEPLNDTLIRSASSVTGAMPIAASTRPQFASEPNSAVLTRLSRATTRAAVNASSSVAAPVTVMMIRFVTPSASACSCAHRSSHTCSTASSNSVWLGAISLAPEASSNTVSLVEQLPSTSRRSNVSAVALRRAWSRAAASATASVVMTVSMVASDGASMPAPLAMPPTVQLSLWCNATCFGTVSVVMMARAASSPPVSPPAISCTISVTPASTLSIGSRSPISPVEQTATSMAPVSVPQSDSAAATASAVACVS